MKIPVLIAGAGPVGLTLALDLAWRGVPSLLVEPLTEVHAHPRAISIGVRTMEHFRRLGLDQKVIDAGVPRSRALDVIYVTRMLGREIFRFPIPSIDELARDAARLAVETPEITASPYYKTWTAQSPLERMLRAEVTRSPKIEPRYGWRLDSFVESEHGVTAILVELATGRREEVVAHYLVGNDGANSAVRAGLDTRMSGRGTLGEAVGLYFKAPTLGARLGTRPGVMYWALASGCAGVIYTIDGGDEWVFNRYFAPGETASAEEPVGLIQRAIGEKLDIEILSAQKWLPRQLVADRYQSARCFLAGDACHLFVPTGGFGMNTGIGDAVDLSWKIAARLAGWGGATLLASYETERRPIGLYNTREAADNYDKSGTIFAVPDALEEDSAAGDAARRSVAALLPPKIKHFAPIGVHLGSAYENSPLIVDDGTPPVAFDPVRYVPSARPGQRAPHAWLAPGKSTLDLFGRGFTLLRFGGAAGGDALIGAARAAELPLTVADVADAAAARLYERRLVLVRPDGHVAWRGESAPAEPRAIVDRVRGA
ncbi:MAG TPA: FAD-dependent monooxygenase [Stellaceae bacterium]|jgi:2-polyprenyl-6-methoxyphenol hydroxylase-like FAD-dependent oxidoreductase|nr:FAD-dependent monooxygenase [Stellaceae bacterium]